MEYKNSWKKHSAFCDEIIQEINRVRQNPCSYAPYLQQYIDNFDDGCIFVTHVEEDGEGHEEVGIQLEEGKKVVSNFGFLNFRQRACQCFQDPCIFLYKQLDIILVINY